MTATRPTQGWLGPLLLRLHFYAAILVGPFLLISAVTALVIQWALTVIPPAADLIGLSPLSSWEWLMCALVGASVLAIVEAEKFVRRVAHRRDARQAQSASA